MFSPFGFLGKTSLPADETFFQAVINAGGSLTTTEESAITTLVSDLQSAGIWNLLDAFYPFVGSSSASCGINLVKPNVYTITFDAGYSFTSAGIQGTPSTTNANFPLPNNLRSGGVYSHGLFISNNTTSTQCISNPTGGSYLVPRQTSTNYALASFANNNNTIATGVTDSIGWWLATNDTISTRIFKNNSSLGAVTESRNANGANYQLGYGDWLISVLHFGAIESLYERTSLYNAITAFNTALSR